MAPSRMSSWRTPAIGSLVSTQSARPVSTKENELIFGPDKWLSTVPWFYVRSLLLRRCDWFLLLAVSAVAVYCGLTIDVYRPLAFSSVWVL